jgi:hypothetical protein
VSKGGEMIIKIKYMNTPEYRSLKRLKVLNKIQQRLEAEKKKD